MQAFREFLVIGKAVLLSGGAATRPTPMISEFSRDTGIT